MPTQKGGSPDAKAQHGTCGAPSSSEGSRQQRIAARVLLSSGGLVFSPRVCRHFRHMHLGAVLAPGVDNNRFLLSHKADLSNGGMP